MNYCSSNYGNRFCSVDRGHTYRGGTIVKMESPNGFETLMQQQWQSNLHVPSQTPGSSNGLDTGMNSSCKPNHLSKESRARCFYCGNWDNPYAIWHWQSGKTARAFCYSCW